MGKIAVFIDGANVYATSKALNLEVDYKVLAGYFGEDLFRACYYTAILDRGDEHNALIPMLDWLEYNQFKLVTKPAKQYMDNGRIKVKGNMDIEIAVDAMDMAQYVDEIVIMSGDGDFKYLVEALQRRGCRVTVVSTIRSNPPMCADELRRAADRYIEIEELLKTSQKKHSRYA